MSGIKKETGVGKFSCTYINVGIVSVYNVCAVMQFCQDLIIPHHFTCAGFRMSHPLASFLQVNIKPPLHTIIHHFSCFDFAMNMQRAYIDIAQGLRIDYNNGL